MNTGQSYYQLIVENAIQPILLIDKHGSIVESNKAANSLLGYTADEISALDIDIILQNGREVLARFPQDSSVIEQTAVKENGDQFPVEVSAFKFAADDGTQMTSISLRDITPKKIAQKKLQLINSIGDRMWSVDKDFKLIAANNAFIDNLEHISGNRLKVGDHLLKEELFPEDFIQYWKGLYERAFKGENFKVDTYNPGLNNSQPGWFETTCNPIIDNGAIVGLACYARNVTEKKIAEDKIKESHQRFQYVTKATSEAIWDWDLVSNTVYWGEGFRTIFGYNDSEKDQTSVDSWTSHIHPKDLDRITKGIHAVIDGTGSNWSDEYRYQRANGTYAYVIDKGFAIRNDDGKAIRMVGAMQDITQQKKDEQQRKLLESVITNTNDAVLITEAEPLDQPGPRIVYANEAFSKMTGYSSEEIIGQSPRILQGPKTDQAELKRLSAALRQFQPCDVTVINYKKNGEAFWINFSVSPVADEKGWFTHWISIEKDVSQKKNEELQKKLLSDIGDLFNEDETLQSSLQKTLEILLQFGDFSLAEAWLVNRDKTKINLIASYPKTALIENFYKENGITSFDYGDGFPGTAWATKEMQFWRSVDEYPNCKRIISAMNAGFKAAYGLPIIYKNEVIGVFIVGLDKDESIAGNYSTLLTDLGLHAGAEIRRKQLEQEFQHIFSSVADIICITGFDGYFKKFNPAACALLEYTEQELLSHPYSYFIHPDDQNITNKAFTDLTGEAPNPYFENRFMTKSGKTKWIAWTSTASKEDGLIYAVGKDITEKKELGDLLNKTNHLARIGSWEIDLVNDNIFWSDVVKEIFEVGPAYEPKLKSDIELYKPEYRDMIAQKIQHAIEKGEKWDEEMLAVTAKGNERWVRAIGEPHFVNGKCVRLYGSLQDIHERKIAEEASLRSLNDKNTILESIGDAFFAVDKNWIVTYWNGVAETALRRTKAEVTGNNLWDVFAGSINSLSFQKYHEAIDSNEVKHFEDYLAPLDKWYEISAYPSKDGLSVYFKDVTERKHAEIYMQQINNHLEKQARELAISNTELEQFAYVASHDLQEPLRMVTGFLTQLEKKYADILDEKGKKYIYFAVDGAKRMRQIILDLLEFSRAGRSNEKTENVDLNEVVKEIEMLFATQMADKHAVITKDHLPTIHAHISPLRQVFQNIISNALKYTKKDVPAQIGITVKEHKTHWEFAITDNGIGINEEYFNKIFIIFQRLHTKDEYAGTGMGLGVTKKIIDNYGGHIWVESEEGVGSTFYFTIAKQPVSKTGTGKA